MGSRVLLSLLVFGAILLVACGGDDDDDSTADRPSGGGQEASARFDRLAAQMLLTLEDVPAGLVEDAGEDSDEPSPFDRCDTPGLESEVVGEAESSSFNSADQSLRISHFVDIYSSPAAAASPFGDIEGSGACFADVLNSGELDTPDVTFANFEFGTLADPGAGEQSGAFRLSGTLTALEAGVELPAHIDFVAARVGRVVTRLLVVTFPSTPDASLEAELIATAVERAESQAPGD